MNVSAALTRIGVVAVTGAVAVTLAATPAPAQPPAGLTVFAGTGVAGAAGDGGPASRAQLAQPAGIAVAGDGTVYISDTFNHTVRAVAPDGTIRTVAGTGKLPATAAVRDGGEATQVDLASPADLAVGADGSLYIADTGLFRIFRLSADGHLTTIAGTGVRGLSGDGGSATAAQIGMPAGLAVADDGTLSFGDPDNQRVRQVAPDGTISTVAGDGHSRLDAAGGQGIAVAVPAPLGLGHDSAGDLWIVDASYLHRLGGGQLVTVTATGQHWSTSNAATWPPPGSAFDGVQAVAADGTTVYALTSTGLLRLDADQRLEKVADGLGDVTRFRPIAVAAGAVYLVDSTGNQVYIIHPAPAQSAPATPHATTWWPWEVGGAVAVLLLAILIALLRRRAAH